MNNKLQQEKESLYKKGVKTVQIKVDALVILDEQGYVTGIKLPNEAEYLGKEFKQLWSLRSEGISSLLLFFCKVVK